MCIIVGAKTVINLCIVIFINKHEMKSQGSQDLH